MYEGWCMRDDVWGMMYEGAMSHFLCSDLGSITSGGGTPTASPVPITVGLSGCSDLLSDIYCPYSYNVLATFNLSKTKNIPPKALIFSDFCCTFATSLMILLVLICSTKVSEKSDMAKSWAARLCRLPQQELFVAQVLIKNVKLKCCGI